MKRQGIGALLVALAMFWASAASAASVKSMNLQEIAAWAGTIFAGRCVGVSTVMDERSKSEVTEYRFAPARILKGPASDVVTLRVHGIARKYARVPEFAAGEQVVLFMYPESELGVSTPVGLGQGKFTVITAADGSRRVVNERNNQGLFKGMSPADYAAKVTGDSAAQVQAVMSAQAGPIGYELFLSLVAAIVQ